MSWTTSTVELRHLLKDNDNDRLRWRKKVLGDLNGSNTKFKTFEFRRVSSFVSPTAPIGVYKNGSSAAVSSDNPEIGEFTLSSAPADGDILEATYYVRFFLDAELNDFILRGTKWLGLGADQTKVPDGLQSACLKYAASEAYQALSLRFIEKLSETYLLEDSPDPERMKAVDTYRNIADDFYKQAHTSRDDYYTRQGQSLAPLWGVSVGNVKKVVN